MATLEELEDVLVQAGNAGDQEAVTRISDAMKAHPTFQRNAREKLESEEYRYDENFMELDKDAQRANMSKYVARSMGLNDDEVDVTQGMGTYGRFKLSFQPTEQDKVKHLEDTYGRENIRAVDIGGKMKLLYRDEQETGGQFRAVDEEGVSLADFFGDTAGEVLPTAGAVAGGIAGLAGGIPGSIAGAAAGGALARGAQDITTRAISGEEQDFGEMLPRLGKEALISGVADVFTLGTGKLASRAIRSKLTGDASAQAFERIAGDLPEGTLTPRMMQGGEKLTRELGIEDRVGGRVGEARQAIDAEARRTVGDVSTESFEEFTRKATQERDELLKNVDSADTELASQINKQYNDKLRAFGAGDGRVMSDIGDEIAQKSINPALQASRRVKNDLYTEFDRLDAKAGGIFDAKSISDRFGAVIAKNKMKNTSAIKTIQGELKQDLADGKKYTIGEIDTLIDRVTDAMPAGVLKDKTASQVAAELSDSLSKTVRSQAKKYPELNEAWKSANKYYKDTYTKFGRGGIGGVTRDASGEASLSGQGLISSLLSDPRQIKNVLSVAKEGGISPSVVKTRLKEAFLTSKSIRKGESIDSLALSEADRSVVKALWGARGLKRLEAIKKGLKGTPEDLEAYLGALSDKQAKAAKATLDANAEAAAKLEGIENNSILRKLTAGDMPTNDPRAISKAFLGAPPSKRREVLKTMAQENPQALADLKSVVGSEVLTSDLYASGFKNAIGEPMFNGKSVLARLKQNEAALRDVLGNAEYDKLRRLADAQSRLAPLTRQEAEARLRTTFGAKGVSLFVVGDLLQSIKDKAVALAYRTKSLDKFMSGWSKADPEAIKNALNQMVTGQRASRAFIDMDDPDFEQDIKEINELVQ